MNIKAITLFSGYDSQCMALDRLHSNFSKFNYELVGWSEINKYAIQAHNAIYPQWKDRNLGDVCKIDWSLVSDFDLLTYSSPCQDFSQAGHQKGGKKGSGTRSSLLWECERAIKSKRPKYLLMENVSALVSKKFIKLFNKWQSMLESYGYTNYAKVLNAKDFEVPQNRERIFMISVRNDVKDRFYFPQPYILDKRLKDVLEEKVDEKYYLPDSAYKNIVLSFATKITEPTILAMRGRIENKHYIQKLELGENISNALTSVQKDNLLYEPKVNIVGNVNPSGNGMNGNIFSPDGIAPTILINKGEGYKIFEPTVKQICNIVDNSKNKFKNPQRGRVYSEDGISPAIQTYQGGNLEPKILQRSRGFNKGGEHDICPTIGCGSWPYNNLLNVDYRIRKLTPKECFRLMDAPEENINELLDSGISNSQLYKLAGNSIVVNCLYHIFRKLFMEKQNDDIQLTLF